MNHSTRKCKRLFESINTRKLNVSKPLRVPCRFVFDYANIGYLALSEKFWNVIWCRFEGQISDMSRVRGLSWQGELWSVRITSAITVLWMLMKCSEVGESISYRQYRYHIRLQKCWRRDGHLHMRLGALRLQDVRLEVPKPWIVREGMKGAK